MLQQTSILAYRSLPTAKINARQQQVLEALEEIQPANNRMLAEHSKLPINVITPRMGELRKKGKVVIDYIGRDVTGRQAMYWKANNE